jgi:hypothetical protein
LKNNFSFAKAAKIKTSSASRLWEVGLGGQERDFRTALIHLSPEELDQLRLQVGRYAFSKSRRLRWRTGSTIELPGGETVFSIVSKAFEKLISGERGWNPAEQPSLQRHLESVVDSLLSHLVESADNKLLAKLPTHEAGLEEAEVREWRRRGSQTPEEILLQKERDELDDIAIGRLEEACSDDPLLRSVVAAMRDGLAKPADIAEVTSHSVKDINNCFKRLDRKCIVVGRLMRLEYGIGGQL